MEKKNKKSSRKEKIDIFCEIEKHFVERAGQEENEYCIIGSLDTATLKHTSASDY